MIQKFLREAVADLVQTEEGRSALEHYRDMRNHPGWQTHQKVLLFVAQQIGNDMLSKGFTDQDPTEKDRAQRAYHEVYEVIKLLLDPEGYIKTQQAIKHHNMAMAKKLNREQPK